MIVDDYAMARALAGLLTYGGMALIAVGFIMFLAAFGGNQQPASPFSGPPLSHFLLPLGVLGVVVGFIFAASGQLLSAQLDTAVNSAKLLAETVRFNTEALKYLKRSGGDPVS